MKRKGYRFISKIYMSGAVSLMMRVHLRNCSCNVISFKLLQVLSLIQFHYRQWNLYRKVFHIYAVSMVNISMLNLKDHNFKSKITYWEGLMVKNYMNVAVLGLLVSSIIIKRTWISRIAWCFKSELESKSHECSF